MRSYFSVQGVEDARQEELSIIKGSWKSVTAWNEDDPTDIGESDHSENAPPELAPPLTMTELVAQKSNCIDFLTEKETPEVMLSSADIAQRKKELEEWDEVCSVESAEEEAVDEDPWTMFLNQVVEIGKDDELGTFERRSRFEDSAV